MREKTLDRSEGTAETHTPRATGVAPLDRPARLTPRVKDRDDGQPASSCASARTMSAARSSTLRALS